MTVLRKTGLAALVATCFLAFASAHAEQAPSDSASPTISVPANVTSGPSEEAVTSQSNTALAKQLQNPLGNLIIIPFQNNTDLHVGPDKGTADILNIQPVIPIHLSADWNLITRMILPLVWSPTFQPAKSVPFGTGPTALSMFLSPANDVDGWVWGVGPSALLPTSSNRSLGSNVWGVGPAFVVVKTAGPIVAGALVSEVFSLGGTSGRGGTQYDVFTANPFFNYNFNSGWFVGTVPTITSVRTSAGERWTLPVGANIGRVVKIGGKLPVALLVGAYYNAVRPRLGATWQLRSQIAIIF
jgi:hypothetical protein